MAEKNSKSKNVENTKSTLATTQEKTTKSTASKTAKADGTAKATPSKATATTTAESKKTSSKTADSKVTKTTTAKADTTKSAEPKATKATKAADTKPTAAKAAEQKKAAPKATADSTKKTAQSESAKSVKTDGTKASPAKKVDNKKEIAATKDTTATAKAVKSTAAPKQEASTKVTKTTSAKTDTTKSAESKTAKVTKVADAKTVTEKAPVAEKATAKSKVTKTSDTATKSEKANESKKVNAADLNNVTAYDKVNSKQSKKTETSANNEVLATKKAKTNKQTTSTAKNTDKKVGDKKLSLKERLAAIVANDSNTNSNGKTESHTLTFKDFITNKKLRLFAISAIILLFVFILILSVSIGAVAANKDRLPGGSAYSVMDNALTKGASYDYEYRTTAVAGYTEEFLGYVDRKIPKDSEITNQGMVTNPNMYPTYGYTPRGITENDRRQLISEAWKLCSINTRIGSDGSPTNTYNKMDKDGNLSLTNGKTPDENAPTKLYKHTSAVGMYYGDVSNDEKAIIKKMTFNPRSYSNHEMYNVTGIYAPAGEVIKIEISEEDMNKTNGIMIHIGQALYNRKANNIWLGKGQMQRFPVILNTMVIDKTTAEYDEKTHTYTGYVGSFLGGPLYICTESKTFTVTVSGGVRYSHFILGHTTPEDFEANKDSSAPYFDLEVWDNGVLHSGPKLRAQNFSYDDLFKVAELWDKVTAVTTTGNNQNIVFLYDPFVAAGAAVAFPGQHAVNCPDSWMSNSLNYETIIKSGGWGNFHEYHHNFQGYGVGNGGEVTNNGLTLVSYALFTKISANRGINSYGSAGLGGWNSYTSATWALNDILKLSDDNPNTNPSNGAQGLALYATLLHNFGADAFIQVRKLGGGQSYKNYFKKWEQYTHNNMTYYFKDILKGDAYGNLTDEWLKENSNPDYPMFVPVSSVYQTGRSYIYDDEYKYFQTMQPYVIPYGEKFVIDLSKYVAEADGTYKSGSIVIPNGFTYKIKSISQPENGSITKEGDYLYTYTPSSATHSGEIIVTLQITKDDNAFKVEDIDLVLGFEQSHELTGRMLQRTTYEFDSDTANLTAAEAFETNYQGSTKTTLSDNKNAVQNSNTDIWLTADNRAELVSKNAILEVKGKFYVDETTKYRFMLRGRGDIALYISLDNGKSYEKAVHYKNTTNSPNFPISNRWPSREDCYKDYDLQLNTWVYFKMVLVVNSHNNSFIGLGTGKVPLRMPLVDEYGDPVLDNDGNYILAEQEPTTISYASTYRETYQFPENKFNPTYFYNKQYSWSYRSAEDVMDVNPTVISSKYKPWDTSDTYKIGNLFDNDNTTYIHTNKENISEANPFELVVQLDKEVTANRLVFYGTTENSNRYSRYLPRNVKVWVSNDGENWTLVADVVSASVSGVTVPIQFNKTMTFSYYKTQITDTHAPTIKYLALDKIEITNILQISGGTRTGLGDKNVKLYGTWNIESTESKFGRVYIGKQNSSMEFEFTGIRLILFSSIKFDKNYEVYIDGKKVESINISPSTEVCQESFISSEMKYKKHTVTIKCLGEANFESIVVVKPN